VAHAPPAEHVRAWQPRLAGVREVFHAQFVAHRYPPHTHDAWTVLMVDDGVVRYRLDRHDHGSFRSVVSVLPPHVTHDGRAATGDGFRKRVLYLEPDVLGEGRIGRAVDHPTVADAALVRRLRALHGALGDEAAGEAAGPLEAESRLAFVVESLAVRLDGGRRPEGAALGPVPSAASRRLAEGLRGLLDACVATPVTLAGLAERLGASPTHLIRCFTREFGVAPHAYLVACRIDAARRQLLAGRPPAEVAVAAGFHDQPHLTRHFRRHVGTTPARYARGLRVGG
jgi:AraC-like DNA-binding protein